MFERGEEEYEHLLLDLKALGLGIAPLPDQEDQIMFDPGDEIRAHEALDSPERGEQDEEVTSQVLPSPDMDWDDNPWYGVGGSRDNILGTNKWGRGGMLDFILWGRGGMLGSIVWGRGGMLSSNMRGRDDVLDSNLWESVVCPDQTSVGEVVCPGPSCGGGVVSPAPTRRKRKKTKKHTRGDRQVLNTLESSYYQLCGWCNAQPKEHSQQSIQLCCSPTGTQCPDLSSYKAATGNWWQSEDAMSSNSVGVSSKKSKRINAFPLVGKQKQVNFDHQQMATFDERIKKAALAIELRAITRAGARGTPTKSPEATTTTPPKIPVLPYF